ncbi:MAG: hypothetical protein JNJ89_19555 [Rubrivivax sp.]|nr:hypothetical protein [Rubrivivax sp.]
MILREFTQRGLFAVAAALSAGVAAAHPGHDHGSWVADILHLVHALAPLLVLLAVGVGGVASYRLLDRDR